MAQVDPRPLSVLVELFGGGLTPLKVQKATHSQSYVWNRTGRSAYHALVAMEPFLQTKGEQARLAIDFQQRRVAGTYSAELDAANAEEMKALKKARYAP